MTKVEMKTLKMNIIGGMNDYILEVIGDDEITEGWLMYGVPDCPTEDDIEFIAENGFEDLCVLFGRLIRMAND